LSVCTCYPNSVERKMLVMISGLWDPNGVLCMAKALQSESETLSSLLNICKKIISSRPSRKPPKVQISLNMFKSPKLKDEDKCDHLKPLWKPPWMTCMEENSSESSSFKRRRIDVTRIVGLDLLSFTSFLFSLLASCFYVCVVFVFH